MPSRQPRGWNGERYSCLNKRRDHSVLDERQYMKGRFTFKTTTGYFGIKNGLDFRQQELQDFGVHKLWRQYRKAKSDTQCNNKKKGLYWQPWYHDSLLLPLQMLERTTVRMTIAIRVRDARGFVANVVTSQSFVERNIESLEKNEPPYEYPQAASQTCFVKHSYRP